MPPLTVKEPESPSPDGEGTLPGMLPAVARPSSAKGVTADRGALLIGLFNEIFERQLRPYAQSGAVADHTMRVGKYSADFAHLSADDWRKRLENVKANPPDYWEGRKPELMDVFGKNAILRTVENDGQRTLQARLKPDKHGQTEDQRAAALARLRALNDATEEREIVPEDRRLPA